MGNIRVDIETHLVMADSKAAANLLVDAPLPIYFTRNYTRNYTRNHEMMLRWGCIELG